MKESISDYREYLNPQIISRINNLDLRARLVVEGFMVGLHKSPYHGFSVEFSQHRPYMQGDNLRNVDWRVFGKTEKYYIKQYEEETNLRSYIILDSSKSMGYSSNNKISKLDYASTLVAALSYMMIKQQDAISLTIYSDEIKKHLPPKSSNSYLQLVLKELVELKASSKTNTSCLLYTSDAADERSSVDLGGRRIIKKKNKTTKINIQNTKKTKTQLNTKTINTNKIITHRIYQG